MENELTEWLKARVKDWLKLEREAAENRQEEMVARLAIELGRPPWQTACRVEPDVAGALRLLAEVREARTMRADQVGSESFIAEWFQAEERDANPPLLFHRAGRNKVEQGSGGLLSCGVLCDSMKGPDGADRRLVVGRFELVRGSDGKEEKKWVRHGTWEVLRDVNLFRKLVRNALEKLIKVRNSSSLGRKIPALSDEHVSEFIKQPEIWPEFFRALLRAKKEHNNLKNKGSAGDSVKPPRGKRRMGE